MLPLCPSSLTSNVLLQVSQSRPQLLLPIGTSFPPGVRHIGWYIRITNPLVNTKQLLDEVEHDIMNYQKRGLCYPPQPSASATQTRGFDNS